MLFSSKPAFSQTDTLKVLVLSPYSVRVCDACKQQFDAKNDTIIQKRHSAAEMTRKERDKNIDTYSKQPEYTKLMFENGLSFLDSLTLS